MGNIQKIMDVLNRVKEAEEKLMYKLHKGNVTEQEFYDSVQNTANLIDGIHSMLRTDIYEEYKEFFEAFKELISKCRDRSFLLDNVDSVESCLTLFVECIEAIVDTYSKKMKKCVCCGYDVMYEPLSSYYSEMRHGAGDFTQSCPETLNSDEYQCPICGSSDRDRLMVSYLKELQVDKATKNEKLLQIAPAGSIEYWIHSNCKKLTYHSTDLFMECVTFKSDIQDMNMIKDGSYDFFICSHVLEHVEDDRKAMGELYRILSNDGIGIFLVPIDLNTIETDEEWGLSEEENWRRFGQGDHCRTYARKDVIDRLKGAGFCVNELGKEHFGEEIFNQCGLLDSSILYVLTKGTVSLEEVVARRKKKRTQEENNEEEGTNISCRNRNCI